jgi:hypothetical protein
MENQQNQLKINSKSTQNQHFFRFMRTVEDDVTNNLHNVPHLLKQPRESLWEKILYVLHTYVVHFISPDYKATVALPHTLYVCVHHVYGYLYPCIYYM